MDSHCGEGTYSRLAFDPNNEEKINLPWTKVDVNAMGAAVIVAYRKMTTLYTKGTGGGDGHPAAYSVWEQRDALAAVTYSNARSHIKLHLSVVHCWDKSFCFPLVVVKGCFPKGCTVDEDNNKISDTSSDVTGVTSKISHQRSITQWSP